MLANKITYRKQSKNTRYKVFASFEERRRLVLEHIISEFPLSSLAPPSRMGSTSYSRAHRCKQVTSLGPIETKLQWVRTMSDTSSASFWTSPRHSPRGSDTFGAPLSSIPHPQPPCRYWCKVPGSMPQSVDREPTATHAYGKTLCRMMS